MIDTKNAEWYCMRLAIIIICLLFIPGLLFAHTGKYHPNGWVTETRGKGRITISYNISRQNDTSGNEVTVVEYISTTTARTTLTGCIDLLTNVSRHTEFTDSTTSELVRTVSENSWIIRYYSALPWPLQDFDCVATMVFSENKTDNTALFRLTATPDEYRKMGMKRSEIYETTYTFTVLDADTVSITISTKMSPPINVPQFMIKMGIVDSAAGTIKRLTTLLEG